MDRTRDDCQIIVGESVIRVYFDSKESKLYAYTSFGEEFFDTKQLEILLKLYGEVQMGFKHLHQYSHEQSGTYDIAYAICLAMNREIQLPESKYNKTKFIRSALDRIHEFNKLANF